ncbi:MAG: hypothetical protein BAJATHORv1_30055 [Candidatus Thorarchaeota archaeon]|nr:MAG: hypothetical protein BAJATHORv1_30055 [Candidatus Thorarchaeota archaeon]
MVRELLWIDKDRRLNELEIPDTLLELDLEHMEIMEIDLEPLRGLENLEMINLSNNPIEYIDLEAIAECPSLKALKLAYTNLDKIDLLPFKENTELEVFDIKYTDVSELDLTAFSNCTKLRELRLEFTEIHNLDLAPLVHCKNLEFFSITSPEVLDFTVFAGRDKLSVPDTDFVGDPPHLVTFIGEEHYPNLSRRDINSHFPVIFTSLDVIVEILPLIQNQTETWKYIHLFWNICRLTGLGMLGLVEADFELISDMIGARDSPDALREIVLDKVLNHLDKGGTTLGLDLDSALKYSEIAIRTPQILEQRNKEIKEFLIPQKPKFRDFLYLWITSFGFRILTKIKPANWDNISKELTKEIINELEKNGIPIQRVPIDEFQHSQISWGPIQDYIKLLLEMKYYQNMPWAIFEILAGLN